MKLTSIITVNFNQPEATKELLNSLKKYYSSKEIELILVDNGSNTDHESDFKNHYPEIIYIRSEENLGFAGGNNLGIKIAKGDYLLLINNDTEVIEGSIETMIKEMEEHPEIGLLSPLLLYYDDKNLIQYAGFTQMNYLTGRNSCIGQFEKNENQYNSISRETGFCHGAAMMCRKEDLLKAGLMAENYFLYYEELDWCEKFKKTGKKIWFTGKTHIYHKESISVGKESALKTYFNVRNRMLFIRKNTSLTNTVLFSIYYTFIACPKLAISYLLKNRTNLIKWIFKGIFWNFSNKTTSQYLGFPIPKPTNQNK
jgi:GT2 family glycosyltransferase